MRFRYVGLCFLLGFLSRFGAVTSLRIRARAYLLDEELLLEIQLYLLCPFSILYVSLLENDLVETIVSLFVQSGQTSQAVVQKADKLDGLTCSWSGWVTFVTCLH